MELRINRVRINRARPADRYLNTRSEAPQKWVAQLPSKLKKGTKQPPVNLIGSSTEPRMHHTSMSNCHNLLLFISALRQNKCIEQTFTENLKGKIFFVTVREVSSRQRFATADVTSYTCQFQNVKESLKTFVKISKCFLYQAENFRSVLDWSHDRYFKLFYTQAILRLLLHTMAILGFWLVTLLLDPDKYKIILRIHLNWASAKAKTKMNFFFDHFRHST